MRPGAGNEIRGGVEGGVGVQGSEEGVGSFHSLSAVTIRGLQPAPTAKQVPSCSIGRLSNEQYSKIDLCRVVSSPPAIASRLWSFGSAEISLTSATTDISIFNGQQTGMNRWKGDARKPVEVPEIVGGKADSADSSFGSTLSKKTKGDFKLRANQALKPQFKENLATSPSKQSMSQNNEVGSPMDLHRERDIRKQANAVPGELLFPEKPGLVPQKGEQEPVSQEQVFDMQHIRSTILKQEAVFRDQVRELHRVHKVQTRLMAEMRRKDFDLIAHSTGANVGGSSQSSAVFAMNPGPWNCSMGQVLVGAGNDFESSIALPETLKGGSTVRQRDSAMSRPLQEANLFKQSPRVRPARRTFDLERPPDDDEDEQLELKENDSTKPEGNCIKLIESPESCTNDTESDMFSLHLSTGFGRGNAVKDDSKEHANRAEYDISRGPKRPREEAALFPFLETKSEGLRDAPLRPTPTVARQNFLGGLWGLQLGRKVDGSSTPDENNSPEVSEAPKKKERLSLNLGVEEKEVPTAASNGAPHWLLKAPAAKPPKKAVCQTESSSLNFQDSFSPPRNSSEQGMMKSFRQSKGESGSGSTPGMVWNAERHVSDNPPRNRSQSSHDGPEMAEDNMQAGARGVYQAQAVNVGSKKSEHAGYGQLKLSRGEEGEAPVEALSLYSSWREVGDVSSENFSQGVLTQSHPISGGFGVQLRTFEGHPSLAAQGLVQVGPAVNIGTGSTAFLPDSGAGIWYQQTSSDSQYQQYQRHQQLPSRHTGVVSSPRQGPWPAPMHISQGGGYGQGTVFAISASGGPPLGFPVYGVQKVGDELPGPNWTAGSVGPPFTPFSIVVPPKPPFKRPPKLVLTHDGTSMELKLVSPEREAGTKVIVEKSFSGSSGEDFSEKKDRGSADVAMNKGRVQDEADVSMQSKGRREREKTASNTGTMKEKGSPASGGASGWMAKVMSSAAHRTSQAARTGMQNISAAVVPIAQQEGVDDADGGSSDGGSGGSGVGDVINPGDGASPSIETFVHGGSSRNLPAGEGEEGVNMGELGLQADSESQSGRFNKKDKPRKNLEESQGHVSASLGFRTSLSMVARKISRENSDGPGHVVDNSQKYVRGTEGISEEVEKRAPVYHVLEQSGSSSGAIMNLLAKESQSHGLCPQQSLDELRNAQVDLQQSTCSTSQSRMIHPSKVEDSLRKGKEISKGAESPALGLGTKVLREQYRGRELVDIDDAERGKTHVGQRNGTFSNFGDISKQERESKVGHSKQLSGAITSDNGGVQQKPYSPVLRQVPSPSATVDLERHAEGSSKKVSQASETDQGNGRSPRRISECIGPRSVEQDHFNSPGGIDSSCEEVDGTLTSCNDSSITWSELEEEVQRTW